MKLISLTVFIFAFLLLPSVLYAEPIAIIVSEDNPLSNVSKTELKRIFEGRVSRWKDGQKVLVIDRGSSTGERRDFYRLVHQLKPEENVTPLGSNKPYSPLEITDSQAAVAFVSKNSNAISYVYGSKVSKSVKTVMIDNYDYREKGYPLQ